MIDASTRGQLRRFLVVGGCGFLTDVLVFQAAFMLGGGAIGSRLLSASVAITLTWYMNRAFTFGTAGEASMGMEYLRYLGVQAVGLVLNLGSYFLLVLYVAWFGERPLLALCVGAGLAIVTNFLGSKLWAFRPGGTRRSSSP